MADKLILDLGCGTNLYPDAVGVDLYTQPISSATVQCNLGFEPLPFNDDSVDFIVMRHILEHIPDCAWITSELVEETVVTYKYPRRLQPTVYLFNEMWRVLKHNAEVYIELPIVNPNWPGSLQAVFQDPTHVSFWPLEKFNYFSGDYYTKHDIYGHTSRFEWLKDKTGVEAGWIGKVTLRAIKNLPENYPYHLDYDTERANGASK